MHSPLVQHTIDIFNRLYTNLPPLVPDDTRVHMKEALDHLHTNTELSLIETEAIMVNHAKQVWPYVQAFQELSNAYQARMGEQLFMQRATPGLRAAYEQYKTRGHTFAELSRGVGLTDFTSQERLELHHLLVDIACDVRRFAEHAVLHTDRSRYERRISEFKAILALLEKQLSKLRAIVEQEDEHTELKAEINEQIRGFEHSIALLGPRLDYHEVCQVHDYAKTRQTVHRQRRSLVGSK